MLPKASSIASPGRSLTGQIVHPRIPIDATTKPACLAVLIRLTSHRMT